MFSCSNCSRPPGTQPSPTATSRMLRLLPPWHRSPLFAGLMTDVSPFRVCRSRPLNRLSPRRSSNAYTTSSRTITRENCKTALWSDVLNRAGGSRNSGMGETWTSFMDSAHFKGCGIKINDLTGGSQQEEERPYLLTEYPSYFTRRP